MEDNGEAMRSEFVRKSKTDSIAGASDERPWLRAVMVAGKRGFADEECMDELRCFKEEVCKSQRAGGGEDLV